MKPTKKPVNPNFSSGPCAKRPGWTPAALEGALVGRSHRSKPGLAKMTETLDLSRELLGLPDDYRIGIVGGSDTGAVEMALWSMLGARGVDVLAWESFSSDWAYDVAEQLALGDSRLLEASYGRLPDLDDVDFGRDVIFAWNGTTSGVCVPHGDWIRDDRQGLVFCDATSAVFAMELPWEKLDVVTYSWQKVLGGEAQHGVLILSPRAVERLESYVPPRPLPKLFRMTDKKGRLNEGLFKGQTINTPSLLCIEDALDAMRWARSVGGREGLIARSRANLAIFESWVAERDWIDFLAEDPETRSCTSVCFKIVDPWFTSLPDDEQAKTAKAMVSKLEGEGVAYDINAYRAAPPGLRVWCGATVESADIEALCPWLDWAYAETKNM